MLNNSWIDSIHSTSYFIDIFLRDNQTPKSMFFQVAVSVCTEDQDDDRMVAAESDDEFGAASDGDGTVPF